MTNEIENFERAEVEIARLIEILHKELNYWQILQLFLEASVKLQMRAEAEYQLKKQN